MRQDSLRQGGMDRVGISLLPGQGQFVAALPSLPSFLTASCGTYICAFVLFSPPWDMRAYGGWKTTFLYTTTTSFVHHVVGGDMYAPDFPKTDRQDLFPKFT